MTEMSTRNVLHRLELPDPSICGAPELFLYHPHDEAVVDLAARSFVIPPFARTHLDTYFNCFSVEIWAEYTALSDVFFELDVDAPCMVELWNVTDTDQAEIVAAGRLDPTNGVIELPRHRSLRGIVGARLQAFDQPVTVTGGRWTTTTAPVRDVRLGVGMTTFNRQEYVQRNVDLLAAYAARHPDHLADVKIQIVDNASNLGLRTPDRFDVRVLPNRNLGGAGGFARNLMEYRAEGWATHVLFMDDDISVLPSTIDRTKVFLGYASDPNTCFSGAMLSEEATTLQFEAGARFLSRGVNPLMAMRGRLDLTTERALVRNGREMGIQYGAWWFFAFPVDLTDDNPLPVFVRGDDAEFSVNHARGRIRAMNGVGVWHQAFEYKNNPMMFHLELRNLPLVAVLSDPGYGRTHFIKRLATLSVRSLLSLKYDSADRMLEGANDFLDGPDRWLAMDHVSELDRIRSFEGEKLHPVPAIEVPSDFRDMAGVARRVKSLVAFGLLGGHLVPPMLSRLPRRAVPVQSRSLAAPLGREELIYYWEPTSEGFVTRRDRRRFFTLVGRLLATVRRAWAEFPTVAAAYRARRTEFVSDEYWMRQFELDRLTLGADDTASATGKVAAS